MFKHQRKLGCLSLLLLMLFTLTFNVVPLHAESVRTLINLRGDKVLVPIDVPPKERFVLERLISVEERLIVFLYHDPKFRRPVDYAETYNVMGELLQIAWDEPTGGLKIVRAINLGKPAPSDPARILAMT